MSAQPPEPGIEQLLIELRSDDGDRRKAAAEKIAELRLSNEEIINVLRAIAWTDAVKPARKAAANALKSLGVPLGAAPPGPAWRPAPAAPKAGEPLSRRAKIVQFTGGFVGWYLVNFGIYAVTSAGGKGFTAAIVIFPANIIVLIILAYKRRWVALGMLSAIALNLLVALILGIGVAAWCFIPFFTPGLP
jgi:hypothetical protein